MTTHIVIPDCQVKADVDLSYLHWVGQYIADHQPDKIIQIGDFADMESLSSYDVGLKSFEGRTYERDIEAAWTGYNLLWNPIRRKIAALERNHKTRWNPELHYFHGNHEARITRTIDKDRKLEGTIGLGDLPFPAYDGWQTHPFLEVGMLDGIAYSHYFTSGVMGRPVSSARALVNKKHMSCVQGHVQNWEMHRDVRADGTPILGLFVGSCYLHNEDYLGPQGNQYWRGIWVFHEVKGGDFQPMPVSMEYLRKTYGGGRP